MRCPAKYLAVACILGAALCLPRAVASELVHGKVKATYEKTGRISIDYDGMRVAQAFYLYHHDKAEGKLLRYGFPAGVAAAQLNPKVVILSDEAGNQTGSMVTWTLNPSAKRMTALSPDEPSFVRLSVTEKDVKIQMHIVPKAIDDKGYGEFGVYVPEKAFLGGTYTGNVGGKIVTEKLPPPGTRLARGASGRPITLTSAKGMQMSVSLQKSSILFQDYRHSTVKDRKDTWRIVTGAPWAIDDILTFQFAEAAGQ